MAPARSVASLRHNVVDETLLVSEIAATDTRHTQQEASLHSVEFPAGGGEMGALIRSHDWSSTPLGPISEWPQCLKSAVDIMLPAQAQIVMFWGQEFAALYNDAYAPSIGDKHPRALGRPASENWSELWDDLEPLLQRVLSTGETVFAKDRPFYIERRGYPEDVYFDISYSAVRDDTGTVRGVFCIVSETTERVVAQQALARSQERLSYALGAAGMVGTFDWHIPSDKFYSDARFAEMFSVDPAEAENGVPIAAFMAAIHPDDRPRIVEALDHAISSGTKYAQECRLLRADGTVRWIEARGECLYEQGKPARFPGAVVDITERKRAEEVERRLAAIIASSEDAILSTDLDMKITSWNWGAERLYGYTAEEVIGQSVILLVPEDRPAEEAAIIERISRGERVEPHDTKRKRKDGGLIDVSLTVSPVHDEYGRIVGASKIARDITVRKEAERLQRVVMGELKHRIKNVLATVQAIARQTFGSTEDPRAAGASFDARLLSLARAHDLLTLESWDGAELCSVVSEAIAPYERDRFKIGGEKLRLPPRFVLALSLALHELATNAAKYGALSVPSGHIEIGWTVMQADPSTLVFYWQEHDGPVVETPTRKGFGSRLIEGVLSMEVNGEVKVSYLPGGLLCRLTAPLDLDWEAAGKPSG